MYCKSYETGLQREISVLTSLPTMPIFHNYFQRSGWNHKLGSLHYVAVGLTEAVNTSGDLHGLLHKSKNTFNNEYTANVQCVTKSMNKQN